jgi:hypothetical protein
MFVVHVPTAAAASQDYVLFTGEFGAQTYISFPSLCRFGGSFYDPSVWSRLYGDFYNTDRFPALKKNGGSWVPNTKQRFVPHLPGYTWTHTTSLSADGIITGETVQVSDYRTFTYRWRLDLNSGAYHRESIDAPEVDCPGHVSLDATAPLLLKPCPASTIAEPPGWHYIAGACEPLRILTTGLPPVLIGIPDRVELQAKGGSGSYRWSVEGLPSGVTQVGDSNVLLYTASTSALLEGTFNVVIRVPDDVTL